MMTHRIYKLDILVIAGDCKSNPAGSWRDKQDDNKDTILCASLVLLVYSTGT